MDDPRIDPAESTQEFSVEDVLSKTDGSKTDEEGQDEPLDEGEGASAEDGGDPNDGV